MTSPSQPSPKPAKRAKETHQEATERRRRRTDQEHANATKHGGTINLQFTIKTPPRLRKSKPPKGMTPIKLAVGELVPPEIPTTRVDVDVL